MSQLTITDSPVEAAQQLGKLLRNQYTHRMRLTRPLAAQRAGLTEADLNAIEDGRIHQLKPHIIGLAVEAFTIENTESRRLATALKRVAQRNAALSGSTHVAPPQPRAYT